jgi:multicomponent Na+:H+ antiporter subunit E
MTGKPMFAPVIWLLWIKLIAVLTREIVMSNVQVAKIVLSPKMVIDPKVHHYVTQLEDERLIVVLSNAITLTPGTMTVDVIQNRLTVHALSEVYFKALSGNPVEKILLEMEARMRG